MNNNTKNKDIFDTSFVKPEDVILSDDRKEIHIIHTVYEFDYALYNAETGEQATQWINGGRGEVIFTNLNPKLKYAIRIKRAENGDKGLIHYVHTLPLYDDGRNGKEA